MSSKQPTTKLKEKWRQKRWYTIIAPSSFGNLEIGRTIADSPQKLIGRVVETTLYDITESISQLYIKLYFKIIKVEGDKAYTMFYGHDFARDYLRSLVRRGTSRIDGIFNITSKDGYKMRISIIAITAARAKTSQAHAIRKIMEDIITKKDGQLFYDELAQQLVLGKIASEIYNEAKKIYPLRKLEVRKSKLLEAPQVSVTTQAITQ
ncbi:MAG: 30S ribosomal protein S3ae [Candidatus Methanomethylicota archaeon]|jgi:small subunit ribosomal protein S3Ae|uniref:Small ribosomal subunit protein eS1 n=1 Tax=Thermoproteota archaeon TaxID=2056631 RepID=A0A520KEJ2_9CREN|nr:MAG: 30S ribosomal protein S3ae [Candidatus Verstraetearchaeota archaeon]TDA39390.1 MAG: 30S ribosomal protein S3ae [Candidatus Verstraetearchaeota archaeon]